MAGQALVLTAFCLAGSSCQSHRLNAVEKMMWSTYPIATLAGEAAGFVVTCKDEESPEGVTPVLFTSVHVFEKARNSLMLLGFRDQGEPGEQPLVSLLAYQPDAKSNQPFYVRHPLHDVAAVRLRFPPEIETAAKMPSDISQRKLMARHVQVRAGDEVYFLGYPDVFPGTEGAMPILRSGRVASYTGGLGSNGGRFFINADVYAGDSGGPVFVVRHGRAQLVGIISQRVGPTKESFSHLAVAVDVATIKQTLQLLVGSEKH
jgi:hypothetical protein